MQAPSRLTRLLVCILCVAIFSGCGDDDEAPPTNAITPDASEEMGGMDADTPDMGGDDMDPDDPDMDDPDMGDPDELEVVCPTATPPTSSGNLCDVQPGSSDQVLIQAGTILAHDAVYRDGYVLVDRESNAILCTGCECDIQAVDASEVQCANGVVSPSLINTHEHLTFSLSQPQPVEDERFDHRHDWRRGIRGHSSISRSPGSSTARNAVLYVELRNLFAATTSIAGSVSSADARGLLRNLDRADLLEDGLTGVDVDYRTFPLGDTDGRLAANGCSDYSIDNASRLSSGIYMPHVSEGIDKEARNEFVCMSSDDNGGTDLLASNTSIVHGIGLTARDIAQFGARGSKLIWSPRTNVSLYGMTARIPLFKYYGATIALGTDWSTSGSAEMLRELKCADFLNSQYFERALTDRELWMTATANAAVAMGAENQLGSIRAGLLADIAIFDGRANSDYRAVIDAGPADVALVMRGAEPLLGDANVIESLLDDFELCEELEVCGNQRRVCVERDADVTLSAMRADIAPNSYGPIDLDGTFSDAFCDAPPREPSCVPFRPSEFDGMTANDLDGDGIADDEDICPAIFNPVRPIEDGLQADVDSDGLGDECDICPLNEGDQCDMFDANDRDGDGIPNDEDNCPNVPNPDQDDMDNDGIGDLCDPCPNFDNSDADYCPATVYDVRQGNVAIGDKVRIDGAVVNASEGTAFFVQVNPDDADYMGLDDSGLQVFIGNGAVSTPPDERDIVDIVGTVGEFGGGIQLELIESVTVTGQRPELPDFTVVTAQEVGTGGTLADSLQGTLIRLLDVEVTNPNPDAPQDFGEFELDGALRVDDLLYEVSPRPSLGDRFAVIQGVLHFNFSNSKLIPRKESDVSLGPPELVGFEPGEAFIFNGSTGIPVPNLEIVLTNAPASDFDVDLSYPALFSGPAVVTVPAGQTRASIEITAGATNGTDTISATLNGTDFVSADVTIYDDSTARAIAAVEPAMTTMTVNDTLTFEVSIDVPAPSGGLVVNLSDDSGGDISYPATVTIPADELSAEFDVTAGANESTGITLTAEYQGTTETAGVDVVTAPANCLIISEYIEGSGSNNKAIELYNCSGQDLDMANFGVCLMSNQNMLDGSTNQGCTSVTVMNSKTLGFREVHTLCRSTSGSSGDPVDDIRDNCDEQTGTMNFNGDDRLIVFEDANGDGEFDSGDPVVDALGETDVRPPQTTWQDQTLRRCNLEQYDGTSSYSTASYFTSHPNNDASDYGTPPAPDVTCP